MSLFQHLQKSGKTQVEPDKFCDSVKKNLPRNITAQEVESVRKSLMVACSKKLINSTGPKKSVCKISK